MDPRYITIEIKGSSAKLIGLGFLGIAMIALCAGTGYFAYLTPEITTKGQTTRVVMMGIGIFGTLFFGWTTQIAFSRFMSAGKTIVLLSRAGIHDHRVSKKPIAWDAIDDVNVWTQHGQSIIVLAVSPAVEADIGISAITRWTRSANRHLGADGLSISAAGLDMDHNSLLSAIIERVNAARKV